MIALLTVVHVVAHYVNYNTVENYPDITKYKQLCVSSCVGEP